MKLGSIIECIFIHHLSLKFGIRTDRKRQQLISKFSSESWAGPALNISAFNGRVKWPLSGLVVMHNGRTNCIKIGNVILLRIIAIVANIVYYDAGGALCRNVH